ncbi:hypothetical protein C173_00982 [Paenibacillus sp. FSL R7-277]|uniref:hypothetical protein n=1 Tax=Paenibacillus sp. FSL R7-277 TaxID=1227352 RepID=UPI0003E2BF94|nr:hypothetical protein [Paenibacillus sp. FSL R7-277]ETT79689.1 hypothetical protein C173_00982 [Paenibacillus sp. FSL R7-277]
MNYLRNNYKEILGFIPFIMIIIGIIIFNNSIEKNQSEADNKTVGFQTWQKNVLKDNSPDTIELREAINPDNPIYDIYDILNTIQVLGVKTLKDYKAFVNLNSRIPSYIKKPVTYTIDKSIKESKDIYYVEFQDDNGNPLKDQSGKKMIYKDGDTIDIPLSREPYKYVFIRGNDIIPFVYSSSEQIGKILDITTIPITYIDNETVASTLYRNIDTIKIGSTNLNILFVDPASVNKALPYHFIFKINITDPNQNNNIIWIIGISLFIITIIILVIVFREQITYFVHDIIDRIRRRM